MAWENQYIGLVATKPEMIFSLDNREISADDIAAITCALAPFPKVFVEIGSGSGQHLITRAKRDAANAYVGVELRFKRTFRTAEKAEREGVKNLFLLRTSAQTLPTIFAPATIDGFFILFPDPWAKRRWKKHRLLNPGFLKELHTILKPNGFVSYKTDHQDYFEETAALLSTERNFEVTRCIRDLHRSPAASENIQSEFESLFLSKGERVNLLEFVKR